MNLRATDFITPVIWGLKKNKKPLRVRRKGERREKDKSEKGRKPA